MLQNLVHTKKHKGYYQSVSLCTHDYLQCSFVYRRMHVTFFCASNWNFYVHKDILWNAAYTRELGSFLSMSFNPIQAGLFW